MVERTNSDPKPSDVLTGETLNDFVLWQKLGYRELQTRRSAISSYLLAILVYLVHDFGWQELSAILAPTAEDFFWFQLSLGVLGSAYFLFSIALTAKFLYLQHREYVQREKLDEKLETFGTSAKDLVKNLDTHHWLLQ